MYKYTLPNNVSLSTQSLVDAIIGGADFPHSYLDLDTGAIIHIDSPEIYAQWKGTISALVLQRYLKLVPFSPNEQDDIARRFISDAISVLLPDKVSLAEQALAQDGWEGLEMFLGMLDHELREGWYVHLDMYAGAHLHALLMGQTYVEIEAQLRGCGDCATCLLEATGQPLDEVKQTQIETEEIMQHVARQLRLRHEHQGDAE